MNDITIDSNEKNDMLPIIFTLHVTFYKKLSEKVHFIDFMRAKFFMA